MAAKIKLQRRGAKNQPYYRVVVQDESASSRGKVIEVLGKYHPLEDPALFEVNREKTLRWIEKGAKPTEKVRILLGKAGILPPLDLTSLPKRKPKAETGAEITEEVKTEKIEEPASVETSAGKEGQK